MEIISLFFELKPSIYVLLIKIFDESNVLITDAMQLLFTKLVALHVNLLLVKFIN
jgi:hypothetical protein